MEVQLKSARKMFEDLGYTYKKQKNLYLESITYEKGSKRILFRYDKKIIPYADYGDEEDATLLALEELQAINKQVEELGWNKED